MECVKVGVGALEGVLRSQRAEDHQSGAPHKTQKAMTSDTAKALVNTLEQSQGTQAPAECATTGSRAFGIGGRITKHPTLSTNAMNAIQNAIVWLLTKASADDERADALPGESISRQAAPSGQSGSEAGRYTSALFWFLICVKYPIHRKERVALTGERIPKVTLEQVNTGAILSHCRRNRSDGRTTMQLQAEVDRVNPVV